MQRSHLSCLYNPKPIHMVAKVTPFTWHRQIVLLCAIFISGRGLGTFYNVAPPFDSRKLFLGIPLQNYTCLSQFFKRPMNPEIKSKQYTLENLRGIINALGAFQDNWLKDNHPLRVPLPSENPVNFYRHDSNKYLPNLPGIFVITLGWHTNEFFHRACHLLPSVIPPSRCYPGFWCNQSW